MDRLQENFDKLLSMTDTSFVRYKHDEINWQSRMFGLVGPRGVGKTTLFLQHIKQHLDRQNTLYVSADNLYFTNHTLVELADTFNKQNGHHLFIDEIHKYPNWSRELKQLYDSYPDMQIAFTGSSVLDIYKGSGDLSRRAPIHEMQGLSFREYLAIFHQIVSPVYSLDDILAHRVKLPGVAHPLPLFADYMRRGYYPFSREADFGLSLEQVINQTIESDIPLYANMNVSTGRKLKQLLIVIAQSGNLRETFFYNQTRVRQEVIASTAADFQIGDRTFEVGGKNKGKKQIAHLADAYIVKDDIETGYANIIPLWQFGMNY